MEKEREGDSDEDEDEDGEDMQKLREREQRDEPPLILITGWARDSPAGSKEVASLKGAKDRPVTSTSYYPFPST